MGLNELKIYQLLIIKSKIFVEILKSYVDESDEEFILEVDIEYHKKFT